jgi:hypothetical protein
MTRVSLRAAVLSMAVVIPTFAGAQVQETLQRAIGHYENFAVEKALMALDTVFSYPGGLSAAQLVTAYKYAGAGHAVLGRTTASIRFFREAIKRDTSVALEPSKFSFTEIAQFRLARLSLLQGRPDSEFGAGSTTESQPVSAPTTGFGQLRLGSPTANAFIYVDDRLVGPIAVIQYVKIPAGVPVRVSIRSTNCKGSWDTTFVVPPGTTTAVGRRGVPGC